MGTTKSRRLNWKAMVRGHPQTCFCHECIDYERWLANESGDPASKQSRNTTAPLGAETDDTMSLSVSEMLKNRAKEGSGALLHGSDVPAKVKSVTIKVTDVREAPQGFNAIAILDIEEIFGCTALALNLTNAKALAEKYGDDLTKLKGKKVQLDIVSVNNPSDKKLTRGLRVAL